MTRRSLLLIALDAFSFLSAQAPEANLYDSICQVHMRTFAVESESWAEEDYGAYLRRYLDMHINPKPSKQRSTALFFLKKATEKKGIAPYEKISQTSLWEDLHLFAGAGNSPECVAKSIDRTTTNLGKVSFFGLLACPLNDRSYLEKRQDIIKTLMVDQSLLAGLHKTFRDAAPSEYVVLSFWEEEHFKHSIKKAIFSMPGFKEFNENEDALLFRSLFDHGATTMQSVSAVLASAYLFTYGFAELFGIDGVKTYVHDWAKGNVGVGNPLFPYAWKVSNYIVHGFIALLAGYCCVLVAQEKFHIEKTKIIQENCFQVLLIHISNYLSSLEKSYAFIKSHEQLRSFEEFNGIRDFFENKIKGSEYLNILCSILKTNTFTGNASILSHKGRIVLAYSLFLQLKESFESALVSMGRLEAYCSLASLMKECEGKESIFSFATYKDDVKPSIDAQEFWHPSIDPKKVVKNSLSLGVNGERPNVVLTGPNDGGKSTLLKSLALCVLFAQTIGIVPAKLFTLTPFESIATYLNITDDFVGGKSLFKAEILRAQELVRSIHDLEPGKFSFVIFDEIFNGLSPKEGEIAAYSISKYLGAFSQSITLVATHFDLLTHLELETDTFSNFCVSVTKHPDHIDRSYKLARGVSHQHVAIDMLRNEGFSDAILDFAK